MPSLIRFEATGVAPETSSPAAELITSGAPVNTNWPLDKSADGKLYAGIWQSTPGAWRVAYEEWEYCRILEGRCRVTGDDGTVIDARAGDSFVIRPGFNGIWETVETLRKDYVIRLP